MLREIGQADLREQRPGPLTALGRPISFIFRPKATLSITLSQGNRVCC